MTRWPALAACVLAVAAQAATPPPASAFFAHAERGHYRLSADGRRLAWLGRVAGADGRVRANVFVQPLRGVVPVGRPRQLTHEAARDIPDIAWKGDRTLLFRRDAGGDEQFHVMALDADTGTLRDLTPGEHVRASLLDALPDDPGHVLVTSNRRDPARDDVWRVDLADGASELVAENPGDITRWMTDHHGRVRLALRGDGLVLTWLHRADEKAPWTPLVSTDFRTDVTPRFFDADDRRLLALSNRGRDKEALVRIDPARPDEEQVLFEPDDVDVSDAAWSRAKRRLVRVDYTRDRPAHRFFDAGAERLWRRLEARLPGATISLQDASADEGKFVVAADDERSPGTRWLYDARTGTLHPLGAVNPRLAPDRRSSTRPVVYAARDGLAIHGYLTLPARRPARALACVVHPHGGPWSRDEWGWNAEVRFLASRGFCVLQMNYRGSTGYGRRFHEAGFREWGRAMQDDVTDGARWLVAQGIADPRRLGIVGASYGGYVALAAVAFTPGLYAAAVDMAGPVDLATFLDELPPYAQAQLPELAEMIGDPARDDERARLAAVSPARHADAITTPLLVAQGANDPRVATWRVDRFVEALRRRGVPVAYLRKDDEGHGFRNEENQVEFESAMAAFLEKHLTPGRMPAN